MTTVLLTADPQSNRISPNSIETSEGAISDCASSICNTIDKHDIWIIFGWRKQYINLINKYYKTKSIFIIFWGPEYTHYKNITPEKFLYEPKTLEFISQSKPPFKLINLWRSIFWRIRQHQELKSMQKVDGVYFAFDEEAQLGIPLGLPTIFTPDKRFIYDPLKNLNIQPLDFSKIIIGHCSDPSQNHLDSLHLLANQKDHISEIILPLSYGLGDADYVRRITTTAIELFGENKVTAIHKFLPYEELKKIYEGCGVFILNHTHNKALGTCQMAINIGARIVLNPRGIMAPYFRRLGIETDTMEEFNLHTIASKHTQEIQNSNYQRLSKHTGIDRNNEFFKEMAARHDIKFNPPLQGAPRTDRK